jgi:hypothetical protein
MTMKSSGCSSILLRFLTRVRRFDLRVIACWNLASSNTLASTAAAASSMLACMASRVSDRCSGAGIDPLSWRTSRSASMLLGLKLPYPCQSLVAVEWKSIRCSTAA